MEEKNAKGKNIVIGILSVLLIITVVYIGYDKIINKDNDINNKIVENNSTNNENMHNNETNINDNEENSTTQESQNISFDTFKNNIKKGMAKCSWGVYSTETDTSHYGIYSYRVILTNEMNLVLIFEDKELNKKYGNYKITDGVLGFHLAISGPGGERKLYFINEDGTLGYASIDSLINNGKLDIVKKMDGYKDIVSIIQGSYDNTGRTNEPLFIDINGNVFENSYTAWD